MRASGRAQALPTPWEEVGVIGAACGSLLQISSGEGSCWVGKDSGKTRGSFDGDSVVRASVH